MQHIAIMKPQWKFIEKILDGEKTIESRWFSHKRPPWQRVGRHDVIYFKNAGQMVSAKAVVSEVLYIENLTPEKIKDILAAHGTAIGLKSKDIAQFYERIKTKRHAMLVWLQQAQVVEPFAIDKTGFGAMSAWLTVDDISLLKQA